MESFQSFVNYQSNIDCGVKDPSPITARTLKIALKQWFWVRQNTNTNTKMRLALNVFIMKRNIIELDQNV